MALGVAKALGEGEESAIVEGIVGKRLDLFSAVASTSASGELKAREVLPFGNATRSASAYRMAHGTLEDVIDADGIRSALSSAGSKLVSGSSSSGEVAAAFAKAEASPSGRVRGWRNTMLSDADINYERHARAALGAVIAAVTGDPAIFVSGGPVHQCAPGEARIAVPASCKSSNFSILRWFR